MIGALWRYGKVARAALKEEKARGAKPHLRRDEREFQAAAIEILETPPSPAGRLLAASLILFFALALAWSIAGRLDIHAVLEGKVVPVGQVKVIEPLIIGTVRTIAVRQGEAVREGDLLLELDPTEQTADRTRLEEDVLISEASSLRLRAAIKAISGADALEGARFDLPAATPPAAAELQTRLFRQTLAAFDAERRSILADMEEKRAELRRTGATTEERRKLVAVMDERATMLNDLTKTGSASRASYLERAQLLYEQRAELAQEEGRIPEIEAAMEALRRRLEQRREGFLQELTKELEENEKRLSGVRQEFAKARQKESQSRLRAPVSGVVQQLAVHTLGEVVTTGQQLMIIVPAGTKLEVEAMLLNRDKGFVREGQTARVKLEAFNFTKYGVIDGAVTLVSNDAVNLGDGQTQPGQPAPLYPASTARLVFPVRISLSREAIMADGREVRLTPGMSVSAEVKTGDRRVIEYLLSPLFKMTDEAFRER